MELPKRKQIRLQEYDYTRNGAYFITICTYQQRCIFGRIHDTTMELSELGEIAYSQIINTNNKRAKDDISIDKYIVMPNHVHMIVNVGSRLAVTEDVNEFSKPCANSIATIVGGYKSAVTRNIRMQTEADMASHVPTIWQPRYYEHVIRNQQSYDEIWNYIDTNPQKWALDKYNCENNPIG